VTAILRLGVASHFDPRAFGKEIARIRESKGLYQKQAAERIGTYYSNERAYRRIESGERRPERDPAIAIVVKFLKLTDTNEVNELIGLAGYAPLAEDEIQKWGLAPQSGAREPASGAPEVEGGGRLLSSRPRMLLMTLLSTAVTVFVAASARHMAILFFPAIFYGLLYAVSILIESVLDPRRKSVWPMGALLFSFMVVSSSLTLRADAYLVGLGSDSSLILMVPLGLLIGAAAVQWLIAKRALSEFPVVQMTFQSHTAQAAHLKNSLYFLVAAVLFWLVPSHCVAVFEREIGAGRASWVMAAAEHGLMLGKDLVAFRPEWLWGAFGIILLLMVPMAARLFENLKSHPDLNIYSNLIYLRTILYVSLIVICLIWYSSQIGTLTHTN